MEPFRPLILAGGPLTWVTLPAAAYPGSRAAPGVDATRVYELRSADGTGGVVAVLRWRADAACSALAIVGETVWSMERTRLLRRRVRIGAGTASAELASFPYACDGVTEVELPGGRHVKYLRSAGFNSANRRPDASGMPPGDWVWLNEERVEVLRVTDRGHVTLGRPAMGDPDMALLVVLGWYLILLCAHESA